LEFQSRALSYTQYLEIHHHVSSHFEADEGMGQNSLHMVPPKSVHCASEPLHLRAQLILNFPIPGTFVN